MPTFEAPRRLTFRAIGSFRELKDSYPGLGLGDGDGLGFGSRADCNFTTIISFSFSKCHSFRWRMDSQNGVSLSLVVGSTFSPSLDILSRYAGLSPPSPLETLKTPSPIDYEASTTVEHRGAARALLVGARTSDAGYRPPDQQKRHLLRVPSRRNLKLNEERWTFTKHEVGKALNELLSAAPLPDVQVAHAVLASVHIDSLDELWEHFKDSKLQKRQSSIFRRSTSSNNGLSNWLSIVTGQENIPYIHLLCRYGAGPNLLNRAFVIALARRDIPSMKLLLSFGACILPICKDYVRLSVTKNDVDVIRLLLSAPKGMNVEDWQYSLEANVEGAPRGICETRILLQCIHHRPDIATGEYLLKAIDANNVAAVAVLLSYLTTRTSMMPPMFSVQKFSAASFLSTTGNGVEHENVAVQACERISGNPDYETRYTLYCLLDETNLLRDVPALRQEMSYSVMAKRTSMINLLVKAGVRPSVEEAVSMMDFSILGIMLATIRGRDDVPNLLSLVRFDTSEDDMLRFLSMLAANDLQFGGQPLDQKFIEAISKRHHRAVDVFQIMGATITYKSIQMALSSADVEMLRILLQGDISDDELSPALSDAMKITDPAIRRIAVKMLADKGIWKEALLEQLCLIIQSPDPDLELLKVILRYQLPLPGKEGRLNVFHLAIHKASLPVIEIVCKSFPHTALISEALPKAFSRIAENGGNLTYDIIHFLLNNGARGIDLDKTLLVAAGSKSPRALDIIRVLVKHGADANYNQGNAYAAALNDYTRLEILCKACPVTKVAVQALLPSLLETSSADTQTLELVLQSTASNGSGIDFTEVPNLLEDHPNMAAIITCLMKHGLDINLQQGMMIRFAVKESNITLLKTLLSANTTTTSLKTGFTATKKTKLRETRLEMMRLLLDKAGNAEIGQSEVLYDETLEALSKSGDDRGFKILLAHKPLVSTKSLGIAAAFSSRSTTILEMLLSLQPSGESISTACIAAFRSPKLNHDQKESVLGLLLDAKPGLKKNETSSLLRTMVEQHGDSTVVPLMLIKRGVEVTAAHLEATLTTSSKELFTLLVREVDPTSAVNACFAQAVSSAMAVERRLWIYEALLNTGRVSTTTASAALIISLNEGTPDVGLLKLLLKHGADVRLKEFLPLKLAFKLKSAEITDLLIQSIRDDNTAAAAFDLVRTSSALKPAFRVKVYTSLLKHKITEDKLTLALIDTLKNAPDMDTMKLLLERGASPGADGAKCFVLACKAGNEAALRAMCPYANVDAVTLALIEHCAKEKEVLMWLKTCMSALRKAHLRDSNLLYKAMAKFPDGGTLVEKLLHYGVSAGTMKSASLCKQWKREPLTPLLWGLMSDLKISNRTLLALVAKGDDANLLYSTPSSQVSAAFACMLDPKHNPVLESLLKLHGKDIRISPKHPIPTKFMTQNLPLSDAALYLGNLKAYISLGGGKDVNNGSLHTAALLALPEFVRWLLQWHSADLEHEAFGMMIPLVVACRSEARPWCRVANAEGSFEKRRVKTMQLLARKTDLSWRNRRKTVLHFAIDEGPDALQAMLEALDVAHDARRNERYLYTDREGIVYSLSYYISNLWDPDNRDTKTPKMIKLLRGTGKLKDIMYRPEEPGPGVEQPVGYCGMPPDLQRKWDAYKDYDYVW
ncbi:Ankyrin repeat-containing domain superfamily [Fusarium oxysporum f. sp. vasinfectum]|nr:Ankyrin repeat-containing domain superfamily [Fusarium oxysporum f. sp. vasinfectum]